MRSIRGLGTLLHELDEAIFPSNIYCLCCGSMIDRSRPYSLCDDCIHRFHWITGETCEKCGKALPERNFKDALDADATDQGDHINEYGFATARLCYDCMRHPPLFDKGFSCLTYGLHERELMMDLKYAGKGYIARKFGDIMFDRMEWEIREGMFSANGSPPDIVVPVPLSDKRYLERGYNQSALMASRLVGRWRSLTQHMRAQTEGWPQAPVLYENLLYRTRETRKLRGLDPVERAVELEGVFKVAGKYRQKLDGSKVLLIDDIYTTGATANACTRALLDAGAGAVYLLTLASGGNRRPTL